MWIEAFMNVVVGGAAAGADGMPSANPSPAATQALCGALSASAVYVYGHALTCAGEAVNGCKRHTVFCARLARSVRASGAVCGGAGAPHGAERSAA